MSRSSTHLIEGYIYEDPLDISKLWIYLGSFNHLEANYIGNSLYKCQIVENQPWFINYEQGSLEMVYGTFFSEAKLSKPIGCSLENLHSLLRSFKYLHTTRLSRLTSQFNTIGFNIAVYKYIIAITLSKGYIELPSSFEIVSSDNNSLIVSTPDPRDLYI